ncbi:MAG TPA: hypothetical protein VJT77_09195 [Burkholderiales bacterium]|nr:hypothetical protein [Burkholderiales bacterium]
MKTVTTVLLFALATAACSPREGVSTAEAPQPAATGSTSPNTVAYPQVGEGAADGQVYEYY